jgi:hypothetical protein
LPDAPSSAHKIIVARHYLAREFDSAPFSQMRLFAVRKMAIESCGRVGDGKKCKLLLSKN